MSLLDGESTMDLILWRHAEAEDGFPDANRALTKRGFKQAEHMAAWLDKRLPKDVEILVSPATRTQQTAQALGRPFKTSTHVGTGADAAHLLAAAEWPDGAKRSVLVVGHQPTLGHVASLLLCGSEANWSIKKGAIWWLSSRVRADESQVVLRAMLTPELLQV